MTLNRRQLFRLVGAGAALSSLGTTAAVAAQPKFVEPTAQKPMLLCFNENPLGMSEKAKEAIAKAAIPSHRSSPSKKIWLNSWTSNLMKCF
jgi:histidinol-phosphate aminotransferase